MKDPIRLILILCMSFVSLTFAQNGYRYSNASQELDELLMQQSSRVLPGGSMAVVHQGKVVFEKSYGLANMDDGQPLAPTSQFYIASLSKTFTAAAILHLCEVGQLKLEEPAFKYLPDIDCLQDISIRQLLDHTNGIPDYYGRLETKDKVLSNREVLDFAHSLNLDFVPGTDFAYSNTAYIILGAIIEKVSGISYSEYLKTTFFQPLGMEDTFVKDSEEHRFTKKVVGYSSDQQESDYNHLTYGAGGIYSTVRDLTKWYSAIRKSEILSKDTWQLAFVPPSIPNKRTYLAMGWNYEDCAPIFPKLHATASFGNFNGFHSYLFMVPELDFAIIMLSNSGNMIIGPYEVLDLYYSTGTENRS